MAGRRPAAESRVVAGLGRPVQIHRQAAARQTVRSSRRPPRRFRGTRRQRARARRARRTARRRPAAPGVHVLPPGDRARCAGRPHLARGLRPRHRRDRRRVPDARADDRATHRARQGQDPRREHSIPGARARRTAGPPRQRITRGVPGVQRGLFRELRRFRHPRGSFRRSDPPRPVAARTDAGARGAGLAGADAVAREPPRSPRHTKRRSHPARRTGSRALESPAHRGRRGSDTRGLVHAARRALFDTGRDCRRPCRGAERRGRPTGPRSSGSTTCCCG